MLFEEFLDKISPLRTAKKLGAILFQLPPSFTVNDFKNIEQFLDKLPTTDGYDYAVEFRHPSWGTEGPWEMRRRYINDTQQSTKTASAKRIALT
jgi:uncharacterized protein YecE (DUF72 family)